MAKKETDTRFNRFGTVSFTATSRVNDFIDHLAEGKVMGTRCTGCGRHYFPPRADCADCLASNVDWFDATGKVGKLVTFSVMKYGPIGFENDLPYTIAVVDFGDFRMFGRLAGDIEPDSAAVGMDLTVAPNALSDDRMNFVFKRP